LTGPELSEHAKIGVNGLDAVGLIFSTIAVSDGISMGHEGMRASLVSREIIADSVEIVMHAERFDGMVTIAGCDKSLPGMLMAAGRINRPAIFLYGGSSLPGKHKGKDISIVDVFEGIGSVGKGLMTEEELYEIECNACPGQGSCAGMFTANTMASVGEAIGMSMPGTASLPAEDSKLRKASEDSGKALVHLLNKDIKPRDIMTRGAFLNLESSAGRLAVPGILIPMASPTDAIVLAVNIPAQEPCPGHALHSISYSSSSVISPLPTEPIPSKTSTIEISFPLCLPGKLLPP
jgi:dihydroxy-acid dehydratase